MAHRVISAVSWTWMLALATACDGGGGSGSAVSTGLPPDQKLSELDAAAVQKACQALDDSVSSVIPPSEVVRAQCASDAIHATASSLNGEVTVDVQKCQQMTDACVAHPPASVSGDTTDDGDCSTAMADDSLKSCDATVRDYEACVNAVIAELQRRLAGFICANGKMLVTSDDALDLASLPECKALQDKCPDVPVMVPVDD